MFFKVGVESTILFAPLRTPETNTFQPRPIIAKIIIPITISIMRVLVNTRERY